MGCNYLGHAAGDAVKAVLAAVGHNFRPAPMAGSLALLEILAALFDEPSRPAPPHGYFTDDQQSILAKVKDDIKTIAAPTIVWLPILEPLT